MQAEEERAAAAQRELDMIASARVLKEQTAAAAVQRDIALETTNSTGIDTIPITAHYLTTVLSCGFPHFSF